MIQIKRLSIKKTFALFGFLSQLAVPSSVSFAQSPFNLDENVDFTPSENKKAAEIYVTETNVILNHAVDLARKLTERNPELFLKLGAERVTELKEALELPEETLMERKRKINRLAYLRYVQFRRLKWDSVEAQKVMGKLVYEYRLEHRDRPLELGLEIPGEGRAEPVLMNGKLFIRVIEEESRILFAVVPPGFEQDSKEFQQWIARMRYKANHGQGRPVIVAEITSDFEVTHEELHLLPETSGSEIRNWWTSVYEAPTKASLALTSVSVGITLALNEGVVGYQYMFGGAHVMNQATTVISVANTAVFGIFGLLWGNITDPKNPDTQASRNFSFLKRSVGAATFFFSVQIMNHGVESISLAHVGGWVRDIASIGMSLAAVAVGDSFKELALQRYQTGLSDDDLNVLGVPVKRTYLERIVYKTFGKVVKRLGIMQMNVKLGSLSLPLSVPYYTAPIWMQYLVMNWSEMNGYVGHERLREKWNRLMNSPKTIYMNGISSLKVTLQEINESVKGHCDRIMGQSKNPNQS